jgi:hypothetical protein
MAGPKWDVKAYACPNCGEKQLVYEGSVRWRHGPRPSRARAKKAYFSFFFMPASNQVHYFHCTGCGMLFYDLTNDFMPHLTVENENIPAYKPDTGFLPGSMVDISIRIGYDVRDLKMMGYSDAQINRVLYGRITLQDLFDTDPENGRR